MAQSTMTYILSHILANIPAQMLELAFKPRQFNTTIEQRIIGEVINGPVLLDTNLVGGKPRVISISSAWRMPLDHVRSFGIMGTAMEASYYQVPPEAREYRNISSVLSIESYLGGTMSGSGVGFNGQGGYGNTATGMLQEMLATHTMSNVPLMPQITLEGTNILKFYPELLTDGLAIRVMLEYDSEFLNMNTSAIWAMRRLCLCAVQRYIVTNLIVDIDETEIVAGMEIGIIKTLVQKYEQEAEKYDELLIKVKSAMTYNPSAINKLIYNAL